MKKILDFQQIKRFFVSLFACLAFLAPALATIPAYADEPTSTESSETSETTTSSNSETSCSDQLKSIGWLVCPGIEVTTWATDYLYGQIEQILIVNPLSSEDGSPVYEVWKICRDITNIFFIIFLLIVVLSQVTGFGINNYGIKKALPKLLVAAVLVNLSFLICSLGIEISNIFGKGIRGIFSTVEETVVSNIKLTGDNTLSNLTFIPTVATTGYIATIIATLLLQPGIIWMIIPIILGAFFSVATGLITILLRQAVIILLIMVAPLAIVSNILPNVEQYYAKWKQLFMKMLFFYPAFAVLFGASSLAGFAIIASSEGGFWTLVGIAVQIFPLFLSWKLMQMSGTFLGGINNALRGLTSTSLAMNRAWADSHRSHTYAKHIANNKMPSAHLLDYLEKRKTLREEDTKNATKVIAGRSMEYAQYKISGSKIAEDATKAKTSKYTRMAKMARNYDLLSANAAAHAEHVMTNYVTYHNGKKRDIELNTQSANAFLDYSRAAFVKEIDNENDINFLSDKFFSANKRDASGNPVDKVAFERYIKSVGGENGEWRVLGKIIDQSSRIEAKQRAEVARIHNKYGHNGYNKQEFRSWLVGYKVNDDGWAVDEDGERLKIIDEHGKKVNLETVQGDILTKHPEKMVLYNKRDDHGLYYDMKDQDGNVVARVHRGKGKDGANYDDASFIKETLANYDIPIGDPIDTLYGVLSGVRNGSIKTPQGDNEIGLSRYSTTIGRAMPEYKSNAAWSGAMFNSGIGNRQITNSAQYAIWVLDSIKKTLKPGSFNTQNPASVEYIRTLLNPDNWDKIFSEQDIMHAININNEEFGGEDWILDKDGNITGYTKVNNPTYAQRMNTIKRKLLFPAMKKILPALDRLRTSNTVDNQKPGTSDELFEFLQMVEDKWENNADLPFDVTLVDQDLSSEARNFRARKHDKNGNLIYSGEGHNNHSNEHKNLTLALEDIYENATTPEELKAKIFAALSSKERYARALERFSELCDLSPDASMSEIREWFEELETLAL